MMFKLFLTIILTMCVSGVTMAVGFERGLTEVWWCELSAKVFKGSVIGVILYTFISIWMF